MQPGETALLADTDTRTKRICSAARLHSGVSGLQIP
jgi:hypothetical protein